MAGIIVGVDGSDHSRRALDWAMREAVKHHLPLTVMSIHPGVTREEIGEIITHLAFYAGWPPAMTAARIAKGVFEKRK